jgi:hypothetical protein
MTTVGPFLLGGIFAVLGIVFLLTGQCSGYWALGFGLVVVGIGVKLATLMRQPQLSWRGDRLGWTGFAIAAVPGFALIVVGVSGLAPYC